MNARAAPASASSVQPFHRPGRAAGPRRRPQVPAPPRAPAAFNVYLATCPTRQVLGIVADKWTTLVIGALSHGTKRFQQLRREVDGVTQKMLTQTLRGLERDGLVGRRAYATVPSRVEYSLTPLGRTLIEPLSGLTAWAEAHVGEIEAARAAADARGAGA